MEGEEGRGRRGGTSRVSFTSDGEVLHYQIFDCACYVYVWPSAAGLTRWFNQVTENDRTVGGSLGSAAGVMLLGVV